MRLARRASVWPERVDGGGSDSAPALPMTGPVCSRFVEESGLQGSSKVSTCEGLWTFHPDTVDSLLMRPYIMAHEDRHSTSGGGDD